MEKKKLGVLIVSISYSPNLGGVETHLDDLTKYLIDNHYSVFVVTYQPITTNIRAATYEKNGNLEITRINWFGYNWFHKLEPYPLLEFAYLFPGLFLGTLFFMVKNHRKIDAIHAHGFISTFIARVINLFFHKKTTMSTHAIYDFQNRGLMAVFAHWILKGIDTIMPLALASKNDLLDAGVSESKIKAYRQWVNQDTFKPRDKVTARKAIGIDDSFIILFVGRLIEKKGIYVLANTAKLFPQGKFVFVGNGPEYNLLKEMEGITDNILVVGSKTQKETALYYNAADVAVVPSLYEEGFARVVLEALSSGCPIIASNKGCLPEMILDGKIGFLVDPKPEIIKDKISILFKQPPLLKSMAHKARIFAKERYSDKNAKEIADTYY